MRLTVVVRTGIESRLTTRGSTFEIANPSSLNRAAPSGSVLSIFPKQSLEMAPSGAEFGDADKAGAAVVLTVATQILCNGGDAPRKNHDDRLSGCAGA
jgi:hypothetical protein